MGVAHGKHRLVVLLRCLRRGRLCDCVGGGADLDPLLAACQEHVMDADCPLLVACQEHVLDVDYPVQVPWAPSRVLRPGRGRDLGSGYEGPGDAAAVHVNELLPNGRRGEATETEYVPSKHFPAGRGGPAVDGAARSRGHSAGERTSSDSVPRLKESSASMLLTRAGPPGAGASPSTSSSTTGDRALLLKWTLPRSVRFRVRSARKTRIARRGSCELDQLKEVMLHLL